MYLDFAGKVQAEGRREQALAAEAKRYKDAQAWDERLRTGLGQAYLLFANGIKNLDKDAVTPWEVQVVCSSLEKLINMHHQLQDGTALRSSDATLSAVYLLVEQGILDEKVAQGVTVAHEEMKAAVEDGIRQTYSESHA